MDFLTASEARDRLRRRLRRAGTFVVLVALGVGWLMQKVNERGEEQLREQAAALTTAARAHYRTSEDPYTGLRMAADEVRRGNHGSLATSALVEALNIPVPEESTVLPGGSLTEFADSSSTVPAVRDATGAVLDPSGAPAAAQPVATSFPAVSDRWGDVTVRAANAGIAAVGTASGAVVVRGGARRSTTIEPDVDHGAVTALDVDAATSAVAVAHDRSGVVSVYDPATGELRRRIPVGAPVRGVAISPDGRTLAVGSGERIVLADISTGQHRVDLRARDEPVRAVSWSADGTSVWAITGEHRVSQWRWRDGHRLADDRSAWFVSLSAPSPDGSLIAVTRTGDVHRVRETGDEILARTGLTVLSASVDPAAEQVLLGTVTGELHVLELRTGTARIIDDRPGCTPLSTAWIPQKPLAVVTCRTGPLRWVSTDGSSPSRDVPVPSGGSGAVTAGADGTVYLGAANGLVYRTRAENPELEVIGSDLRPTEWHSITLSPDGQTLLLTGTGTGNLGHLYVGRADSDDWSWYTVSLLKDEAEQFLAAAISPDGQIAAIGVASGTVHFLATRSGNLGLTRTDISGSVTGLRFTDAGLVAASRDGVVERLDPCTGCELSARLLDLADRRLADGVRLGLAG